MMRRPRSGESDIDPELRKALEEMSKSIRPVELQRSFYVLLCEVKAAIANAVPDPFARDCMTVDVERIAKLREAAQTFYEEVQGER